MLERILPGGRVVVATEADRDRRALPGGGGGARARRSRNGAASSSPPRACAREALARLGVPAQPIPTGSRGEPLWPDGIVGSITHCDGYRACAVAAAADWLTIGVDAELDESLPDGLIGDIALPEERRWLEQLARGRAGRQLGPPALQRQGVGLQGLVPAGEEAGSASKTRRSRSTAREAPSPPACSLPGPTLDGRDPGRTSRAAGLSPKGFCCSAIAVPRAQARSATSVF